MAMEFFGPASRRAHSLLVGILATGALVACGDDTAATGSGGGGTGGDSSGDTTAATSTGNGGSDATTTTTTTSGTAGGSGDCEAITLGDFEALDIATYAAPFEAGEAALPDTFQVAVNRNAEGEIALGTGANATVLEAEQQVLAFYDGTEEGTYDGIYFATAGTLTLPAGGAGEASLADVELGEVDPETGELLPDGRCLTMASATFAYDNPTPLEWECDGTYYNDGFFCDCACGTVDPDCDIGTAPVFGCEESEDGPYCTADAVCGTLPTWWECEPEELDDGTTCDCECGGPDGDCFGEPGDDPLPVVNCDAGDNCGSEGVCLAPEDECEDLVDSDEDNSIDCADATACAATDECAPGATAQNGDCDVHSDCASANDAPLCATIAFGVNQNMCSQWCDIEADDCGGTEICIDIGADEGICLTDCTDDEDCPDGFLCTPFDEEGTINGCLPDVPEEWTCDPAFYYGGFLDGCDCGCGIIDPDCGGETSPEACVFCGEGSCALDGDPEAGACDLDALVDDDNSVCE